MWKHEPGKKLYGVDSHSQGQEKNVPTTQACIIGYYITTQNFHLVLSSFFVQNTSLKSERGNPGHHGRYTWASLHSKVMITDICLHSQNKKKKSLSLSPRSFINTICTFCHSSFKDEEFIFPRSSSFPVSTYSAFNFWSSAT